MFLFFFFFSSRRRHTRSLRDWSSDVCSSDLGPQRVRGRPAHARDRAPRGLGRRHRPALDRDRLRRRPAPRRGGRAATRRPAGRRVIDRAALYLATEEDLTAALAPVAGRPLAFRVIAAAIRAGARRVAVPARLRPTEVGAAVAASARARAAVAWLEPGAPLPPGPLLLLPAAALAPPAALTTLRAAGPGAVLATSTRDRAPVLVADAALAAALAPG